jgi:hypothetical protein
MSINNDGVSVKKALWWKVGEGLVYREFPASFLAFLGDTTQTFQEAGYSILTGYGDEEDKDIFGSKIYLHKGEDYYLVEIRDFSLCYVRIFVTEAEKDDFFAKWYFDFLARAASINQTASLARITRSLTAFIRHGTGEDTIDEGGEQTLDDVRRWREARRKEKV